MEINDGEEINMMGGNKSLLSHIKIIDINPYTMQKNPYLDLARNFILYSAAYPVRFEEQTKTINIGKPSTALNVRIYMMSYGDINCKKINFIDADNFDLWREIKYYDWVKNEIIKRKISPNFIAPILYKIDSKSQLDWDKLELIKSKYTPNSTILELRKNQKKINNIHQLDRTLGMLSSFIPLYFRDKDFSIKDQNKDKNDEKEDITINSGKILILLTEAPTSNILQWAACKYDSYGSVKKMITTGYHTPEVWKSILFQLIYACAILQEKIILFENFSLENNIFIKDIYYDPNIFGSWIYKVDNLDYYIPNYGYILVIDSKFCDINVSSSLLTNNDNTTPDDKQKFKIYGNIFKKNSIYDNINICKNIIKQQFREIINPDNFGYIFKIKKGSVPDDSILNLLRTIWNNTSLTNIRDYLHEYFGDFLHNRLGTQLYNTEKEKVTFYYRPDFSKCIGQLMVWQKRYKEFEWVIYVKDCPDNLRKEIIRKENNTYIRDQVFAGGLYSYPQNEYIRQDINKSMKYDEMFIYETYNLDDLSNL